MKFRNTNLIALILSACSLYSCMKCDPYTRTCNLTTNPYPTKLAGDVIYHVKDSGSVYIKSLSYHGPDGWVTIENPSRPFSVSFPVIEGATIGLAAEGIAMSGHFSIESHFIVAGDTLSQKDVCSNK